MVAFGFFPKIFGGGRDLLMILLLIYKYSLSGGDNQRWWGHSNPTCSKKIKLVVLNGGADKNLGHKHLCLCQSLLTLKSINTNVMAKCYQNLDFDL